MIKTIYAGGAKEATGGGGGGGTVKVNAPANYTLQNTVELQEFPREPITAESPNYFAPIYDGEKQAAFLAYDGEVAYFGEYADSYTVLDKDSVTMLNNSYIWIKFNAPVVAKKIKLKHGSAGWRLYATNSKTAFEASFNYTSYDEENGEILVESGEAAEVTTEFDINPEATAYQYYKFATAGTWSNFYEIALLAETGAVRCVLNSKNMTPEIQASSSNYLKIKTQPIFYAGEIIESQTVTLKPYDAGGALINYTDDGAAANLKMFLLTPTGETLTTEREFVQPILTKNGEISGSSFAVEADGEYDSSRPAYKAFDGQTILNNASTDQWHSGYGQPHWIKFYNPVPLAVSKITIYNGAANVLPLDWEFQYSDNNEDWETLASGTNTELTANGEWSFDVTNSGQHKYYRFYTSSGSGTDTSYLGITEIKITGKEYETKTYDKPIYILAPDNSFSTPPGYKSAVQVADLNIPEHPANF